MKIKVPIGAGWTPDLTRREILKVGGLYTAKNILPIQKSYHTLMDKTVYNTTACAGTPINGTFAQDTDGIYYSFLGTSTKLYRFDDTNMIDISRAAGGAYTASSWSFTEYGAWLIAANLADDIQVLKDLTGANFVALGGSPSKARYILLNHGHLILAHLDESGTIYPKKIQYSAREDIEDWTASLTTGAGSQNFPDMKGIITGLGSIGDAFVIASEDSLTVGYYVGGTYSFAFERNIVQNIGCFYPASFVSIGSKVFFWGKYGIYSFDGNTLTDISANIKKTFFPLINIGYSEKIKIALDLENTLVMWAFPSTESSGSPNRILTYNWSENKFTLIYIDVECLFTASTGGILADSLTTTLIDDVDYLVDSNYWLGKSIQPMCVDSNNKVNIFTGAALTAELETGEMAELPYMIHVQRAYLPLEGTSSSGNVKVKHRYATIDALTTSAASTIKTDGSVDLRTNNRFLSLYLTLSDFTKLGNEIEALGKTTGKR